MTDNIEKMARFGRAPDWTLLRTKKGDTRIDAAFNIWALIHRTDDETHTELEAISKNPLLSAAGRRDARATLVKKNLAELEPARRGVAKFQAELDAKRIEAEALVTPKDEMLAHSKSSEIRGWLSRDPLMNVIAANTAMQNGDQAMLAAILDSPLSWPGRPEEEVLTGLREQRIEMALGLEETAATKEMAEIHNDLSSALSSAESGIAEASGAPISDPVAKAAEGESEAA